MARIRTIKPDFWSHEKVMSCAPLTRLLFIGMWNFADDYGRMVYSPLSIKAKVFPNDQFSANDIRDMLNELCSNDLLLIYSSDDKEYIEITGWDHQKIDKRQISKIPAPFQDGSRIIPPTSADLPRSPPTTAAVMEGNGEEGKVGDSEASASGAEAPRDVRGELFGRGLETLARIAGKGPDACRSFVGKCLKAASDDAIVVLGLIEDAERNRVVNPTAWIAARLKTSTGPPDKPLSEFQRGRNETKGILDDLENFATGSGGSSEANPRLLPGNSGERPEGVRSGSGADIADLSKASHRAGG